MIGNSELGLATEIRAVTPSGLATCPALRIVQLHNASYTARDRLLRNAAVARRDMSASRHGHVTDVFLPQGTMWTRRSELVSRDRRTRRTEPERDQVESRHQQHRRDRGAEAERPRAMIGEIAELVAIR